MARILWFPEVLRAAGLTVHEVDGWRTRGSTTFNPVAVVAHATAGSRTATDAGEISVLLNGSSTAPPPIAQLYLGRQGHWWVVASGRCNHIGNAPLPGTGRAGNAYAIGIEAANDNRGEPWPQIQYDSYVRGVAAICRHTGWPAGRVFGHKEISSSGKTDPTFNLGSFRLAVSARLAAGPDSPEGEDDMTPDERNSLKYVENLVDALARGVNSLPPRRVGTWDAPPMDIVPNQALNELVERVAGLESGGVDPEQLAARLAGHAGFVDALADRLAERLGARLANG